MRRTARHELDTGESFPTINNASSQHKPERLKEAGQNLKPEPCQISFISWVLYSVTMSIVQTNRRRRDGCAHARAWVHAQHMLLRARHKYKYVENM